MFARWKESVESAALPSGYHDYTASDFRDGFGVSSNVAEQILKDYRELIDESEKSQFRSMVFSGGGNPARLAKELMERYGLIKETTWRIANYFVRLAWNEIDRERAIELGSTQATWTCHQGDVCRLSGHEQANGQEFAVGEGRVISGRAIFPGSEINCTCFSRTILREDVRYSRLG
jgi:hypothetical protein